MTDKTTPRQLGAILDVLGLDWSSLFGDPITSGGQNRDKVVAWLYRILDTLDHKTGHLLQFIALLLAGQALLAGMLVKTHGIPHRIVVTVLILLIFPLLPPLAGLPIFFVNWRFFGVVREKDSDEYNKERIEEELRRLAKVCDKRVRFHLLTLAFCYLSVLAFFITLVLALCELKFITA